MVGQRAMTVEEFERIAPLLDGPSELVDGRLRLLSPTNYRHGVLTAKIAHILESFVDAHPELGEVVGAETGFRISNPRYPVQAPDAGFVRADRVPEDGESEDSPMDHFMVGAPDLAVEVRSPSEGLTTVRRKAERWLAAGSAEVWIIDGQRDIVHVLRPAAAPVMLHPDDTLTTPHLLPGFSVRVADIFARRGGR
jgi:Uma2 family endonuclease